MRYDLTLTPADYGAITRYIASAWAGEVNENHSINDNLDRAIGAAFHCHLAHQKGER